VADDYLTVRHQIQCIHGGQFTFMPPPMHPLTVRQASVVTEEDILLNGMVVGCPNIGPGLKPCIKATVITKGRTINIITDHQRVVEEGFQALSDGVPPGAIIFAMPMVHPEFEENPPTTAMVPCCSPSGGGGGGGGAGGGGGGGMGGWGAWGDGDCSGGFGQAAKLGNPLVGPF